MVQQRPSASCQGEPGIVKDVPPLRECERGTDGGTAWWRAPRETWKLGDHRRTRERMRPSGAAST